jgi:acyl-CoA thioester hydrolase
MTTEFPVRLEDVAFETAQDALVAVAPITVRRRVAFGDCDPAGVVYTPRFADYLISAFHWFMAVLLQGAEPEGPQDMATPMRGLELDFRRMLASGDWFEMRCYVTAVRTRTFDLRIEAVDASGQVAFVGRLTPIALDRTAGAAISLPPQLRRRLARYQAAYGPASTSEN